MRLLLDTCTALWYFAGDRCQIPERIRETLTDLDHDLYLSDVSILEISIKYRIGKLRLSGAPSQTIPLWLESHDIALLPLVTQAIFRLESLEDIHGDPFDRLLVAQAITHRMTIVTPDEHIAEYSAPVLWA